MSLTSSARSSGHRLANPGRVSKLSIRALLALVQGALAVLACVLLLAITYVLFDRQLPSNPVLKADVTIAVQDPVPRPDPSLGRQAGSFLSKDAVLDQLLVQGGLALGAVAVAATGLAWLTAGRMLRPLHRITATAGRIAGAPAADRGLHERIALNGPADEVKELADTFDLMLSRLDQSFDSQRRFIGNASHELRTPLGLNQALIELALQRTDTTPEMRRLGETLLEVNSRHERLIDGLLVLARSEGEPGQGSFVDLADIAEHVVEQTPAGDVEVTCAVEEAPAIGNPVLLERLVQNLVENGIRYNIRHRGWVRVTTGTAADGSTRLQVSNTGPIVPRHEIPTLFEPFRRLGGERPSGRSHGTSGAGLGLSIVRAVSRAHGGDVQAEPRDGGGLIVTVTLPRAE